MRVSYPWGYDSGQFLPSSPLFIRPTTVQQDTSHSPLIIDVRSPLEYASGHVEGSVNLPLDRFVDGYAQLIGERSRQVVVYCASGARSGQAVQFLMAQGYSNVANGISREQVASRLGKALV